MKDRNVQFPNRFEIVPVPGTTNIFDVTPAPGAVYEEGTFWNKQNVLKDATAALYGKTAAAVPDEIFAAIKTLISNVDRKIKISSGSYTSTGNDGQIITTGFRPKIFISMPRERSISSDQRFYYYGFTLGVGTIVQSVERTYPTSSGNASVNVSFDTATITNTGITLKKNRHTNIAGIIYDYFAIG